MICKKAVITVSFSESGMAPCDVSEWHFAKDGQLKLKFQLFLPYRAIISNALLNYQNKILPLET